MAEYLRTQRLRLRNFKPSDIEGLYDYRNDERCSRYQRGQLNRRAELEELIRRKMSDDLSADGKKQFAIADIGTDQIVGDLTVYLEEPTISLGYTISYKHHRRGYAYELLSALTEWLHARYPERELVCLTDRENAASMGLLEKLGFHCCGYEEKIDSVVYEKWPVG